MRTASLLTYFARKGPVDRILFREPGHPDPAAGFPPGMAGRSCVIDLPFHRKDRLSRLARNARRAILGRPALVDRFGTLQKIMRAETEDLAAVPGVDDATARTIKDGLNRLAESSIFDRYT